MKVSLTSLWRKDTSSPRISLASKSTAAPPIASTAPELPVWPAAGTAALAWIGSDGTARTTSCRLQSRSDHEVRLLTEEALAPDDPVLLILDDGLDCAGRILTCHRAGDKFAEKLDPEFEVHVGLIQADSAGLNSSAAQLKWLTISGVVVQEQVLMQSAEQGQLRVLLHDPLPVPYVVLLVAKGFQCLGSVRSCESSAGRWAVAIEVLGQAYSRPRPQE